MNLFISEKEAVELQNGRQDNGPQLVAGLNQGGTLVSLERDDQTQPDGTPRVQLKVTVEYPKGSDKDEKISVVKWYSEPTRAYISKANGGGDGAFTEDEEHPDFVLAKKLFAITINHLISPITTEDQRRDLLNGVNTFDQFLSLIESDEIQDLLPQKVDVFLEYPYFKKSDKVYLGLPSNRKSGLFIVEAQDGVYTKVVDEDNRNEALSYVNESGEKHPFVRSDYYMNGNFMSKESGVSSPETREAGVPPTAKAVDWS